ncbi:NUDIX hydrolase [Clostridium paraputrificum]|uniref:hypothetical protein n=1 Tax=Clostridium paraputrificum TaxID=29363 RepID=UPI00374F8645
MDVDEKLRNRLIKSSINLDKKLLETTRREHDGIYMFFSFDLENSTRFKCLFPSSWSKLLITFYDSIKRIFKCNMEKEKIKYKNDNIEKELQLNVWKLIGDEILFYKKVNDPRELFYNIKAIYYTMDNFYDELCNSDNFCDNRKNIIKPNIDVKASVWIAKCTANESGKDNYIYLNALSNNQDSSMILGQDFKQMDFLGPDIDEGFRIGKYCSRKKVTISAKLAYIIYYLAEEKDIFSDLDKKSINELFKIVYYTKLRGIWDERLYPIIFYTHKWNDKDELFNYDDYLIDDIVKNFSKIKNNEECHIGYLKKILNDLNLKVEIEELANEIIVNKYVDEQGDNVYKPQRVNYVNSEVHCVAICINSENKVLILKRSENRKRMKGLWECGCAKINSNEDWSTCLKNEYKNNLGLDICIEKNPEPIASYSFEKDGIVVPGIIFKADIGNVEVKVDHNKYSEFRFVNQDDIEGLRDEEFVSELKKNIIKVINRYSLDREKEGGEVE